MQNAPGRAPLWGLILHFDFSHFGQHWTFGTLLGRGHFSKLGVLAVEQWFWHWAFILWLCHNILLPVITGIMSCQDRKRTCLMWGKAEWNLLALSVKKRKAFFLFSKTSCKFFFLFLMILSCRVKSLWLMSYELIILFPYCIANMKKTLSVLFFGCLFFPSASDWFFLANISNTALSYRHQVFVLEKNPSGTRKLPGDKWTNRRFLLLRFYPLYLCLEISTNKWNKILFTEKFLLSACIIMHTHTCTSVNFL